MPQLLVLSELELLIIHIFPFFFYYKLKIVEFWIRDLWRQHVGLVFARCIFLISAFVFFFLNRFLVNLNKLIDSICFNSSCFTNHLNSMNAARLISHWTTSPSSYVIKFIEFNESGIDKWKNNSSVNKWKLWEVKTYFQRCVHSAMIYKYVYIEHT